MLFFSGLSALTYQVVWMREFRLVFGASTASTGAVSALFMAGLGIGGWWLGSRADRHARPLVLYGRLELAISILAGLSPFLLHLTRTLYFQSGGQMVLGFWGATAARLGLAAIVIGIPAVIMGGTLPAAARAITTEGDSSRKNLGLLYGINTLGAVSGVLLSNFILLERLGGRLTLYVAVCVNLAAALLALRIGKRQSFETTPPETSQTVASPESQPANGDETPGLSPRLTLLIAAGVGFVFFLMELVWYRMLSPLLGGSTYTFGLILAIALAGIGIGGALYPAVTRLIRPGAWLLAATCLAEALFMMVPFALGDRIARLTTQLNSLSALGFFGAMGTWSAIIFIVVFPAALISGIQFPVIIALMGKGSSGVGRQTGRVYASNTLGAIAGSLAGGFGLLPLLGASGAWMLCGALLALLGLVIALAAGKGVGGAKGRQPALLAVLGAAIVLSCLTAEGPTAAWRHSAIGAKRVQIADSINELRRREAMTQNSILWEADGVESSVAVAADTSLNFVVNGKVDGNIYGDRGTQIMCGLVGAALHPNPKRSLVVGLGTGCTAGWLSAVESMEQVDVVELEPAVLKMAELCAPANHDVVGKAERGEGVRILINDARETLITSPHKYDIIASEPSNPYRAGIASLFSREFYQEVKNRLTENGIFVNWCQGYEVDTETIFSILATLKSVFTNVECLHCGSGDMLFVASMQPIAPSPELLARRLTQPTFRDAMRIAWESEGLEGFLSRFVANDRFVSKTIEGGIVNTDDKMQIEYAFARTLGRITSFSIPNMFTAAQNSGAALPDWAPNDMDKDTLALYRYFAFLPVRPKEVTKEGDARMQSARAGTRKNPEQVRLIWPEGIRLTRMERLFIAEVLAVSKNEAALEQIRHFEDWWPATAAFTRAHLALSSGETERAVTEVELALSHLRESCWEVKESIQQGLTLAGRIAVSEPQYASRIYEALAQPFSLYFLENERRVLLLDVAAAINEEKLEEVFTKWYEPNPPWKKNILEMRLQCYMARNNPLLARALADYQAFVAGESEDIWTYLVRHGIDGITPADNKSEQEEDNNSK